MPSDAPRFLTGTFVHLFNEMAERLFTMAWEDGHSEGYEAVYSRAEDLSELMV